MLALLGLVTYPFASWYGARVGDWWPALAALATLAVGIALQSGGWVRIALMTVAIGVPVAMATAVISAVALVYAQPVLINAGLSYLFGRTLLGSRTPLITRFIQADRGDLDMVTRRYGLQLTRVWTAFTALLALECLVLAVFADRDTWALVTSFVNYGLTGLLFVVEYPVRVRVLSHLEHRGFLHYLSFLSQCRPAVLLRD
jgi:uncharacterized membrane protein